MPRWTTFYFLKLIKWFQATVAQISRKCRMSDATFGVKLQCQNHASRVCSSMGVRLTDHNRQTIALCHSAYRDAIFMNCPLVYKSPNLLISTAESSRCATRCAVTWYSILSLGLAMWLGESELGLSVRNLGQPTGFCPIYRSLSNLDHKLNVSKSSLLSCRLELAWPTQF